MKKIMLLLICGMSVASAQPMQASVQSKVKGLTAAVVAVAGRGAIGVVSLKTIWAMEELIKSDLSFYTRATGAIGLFITGAIGSYVIGSLANPFCKIAYEELSK